MKSLEYIKNFMDKKVAAYEQVQANPGMYDKATKEYAKAMKDQAVEWYNSALKLQNEITEAGKMMVENIQKIYPKEEND